MPKSRTWSIHCKPVTLTWQRGNGPAWINHFFNSLRDPEYVLPMEVKGVTLADLMRRMQKVFAEEGNEALRRDLERYSPDWIEAGQSCTSAKSFLTSLNSILCHQPQER